MSLKQVRSGVWEQPKRKGYLMGCCDCGLVHAIDFRLVKYGNGKHKIQFRAWRNEKATSLERQLSESDKT